MYVVAFSLSVFLWVVRSVESLAGVFSSKLWRLPWDSSSLKTSSSDSISFLSLSRSLSLSPLSLAPSASLSPFFFSSSSYLLIFFPFSASSSSSSSSAVEISRLRCEKKMAAKILWRKQKLEKLHTKLLSNSQPKKRSNNLANEPGFVSTNHKYIPFQALGDRRMRVACKDGCCKDLNEWTNRFPDFQKISILWAKWKEVSTKKDPDDALQE